MVDRVNNNSNDLPPFFWLHIKKSAGGSLRRLLAPHYIDVDRLAKPMNFIQAHPSQYNAILNNFRIPLGEYQFRRSDFAKTFLFPNTWADLNSFAFVRNPIDRAISAFHYLREQRGGERSFLQDMPNNVEFDETKGLDYQFDMFINLVARSQKSQSIYGPVNLHFSTHTTPMWPDVTDENGNILLRHIFRLEYMLEGVNTIFEQSGIPKYTNQDIRRVNVGSYSDDFTINELQKRKLTNIYGNDFDLYERTPK